MQLLQKEGTHCQSVPQQTQKHARSIQMRIHQFQTMTAPDTDKYHEYSLFYAQGRNTSAPILKIDGVNLEIELDTGATLSEQTYHKLFSTGKEPTLRNVATQLTTYIGEAIEILG